MTADKTLATISPSFAHRAFAVGLLVCLGLVLIWLAFDPDVKGQILRLVLAMSGIGALVIAVLVRRATAVALVLSEGELADSRGRVLCRTEEIVKVDNGAFAVKPSNGVTLRLDTARAPAWAPGLWWRWGRRIGIGGAVSRAQVKVMADLIAQMRADPPGAQ